MCWVPCATAAGPSVPAGVLTNASSDVCPPARSCIQQVCARSMSHKSLRRPMLLQIYDTNCARECNEARCSTVGFEANGANGTKKNNRMANLPLTNTAHAVTLLTIRRSGICSRLNVFWGLRKVRYHGL